MSLRAGRPTSPTSRSSARLAEASGWSVRTYLILIVLSAALALAAASAYGFVWSAHRARQDASNAMTFEAQRAASNISSSVALAQKTVQSLTTQKALAQLLTHPSLAGACQLAAAGDDAFPVIRLDVVAMDGSVLCSSKPEATAVRGVHAGEPWLQAASRTANGIVSWDETDRVSGERSLVVASPVVVGGKPVGTVAVLGAIPQVGPALARNVAGPRHASFTIVSRRTGRVLSSSELGDEVPAASRAVFPADRTRGEWTSLDGSHRLFGSAAVAGDDLRVFAGVRRSAVLSSAHSTLLRQVLVGLGALLLLVVAVWVLNRRVAGPLREVTAAVVRASRGASEVRVAVSGTTELVTLATEFNTMLDVRAGHDAQLAHLASHDPLTGLPNKLLLRKQLDSALNGSTTDLAVLSFGVHRLTILNDSLGNDAVDDLLVQIARRLSGTLRPGDTLARFGGDGFMVLCKNVPSQADAVAVAERMRSCLERPFSGPHPDMTLAASVGIALARPGITSAELMREADSALSHAKNAGSDWSVFDQAMQVRATQYLELEGALRQVLDRDELRVHYQPVLDVATGRITGAEVLVRWQHPDRGLVPPLEFIPIAEETGQIVAIGSYVLTQACEQAAALNALGHRLRMSVNVAVGQFLTGSFPDLVKSVLARTGIQPDQLCLEITESSMMRSSSRLMADLDRLRTSGVHISIDDFGTEYSSLSYLHQLPVDELKIDQSFVRRLDLDSREGHLVEAITRMGRALDLTIVAEGVETGRQLDILSDLGCDLAQGYLISRPQPADRFLHLLQSKKSEATLSAAG